MNIVYTSVYHADLFGVYCRFYFLLRRSAALLLREYCRRHRFDSRLIAEREVRTWKCGMPSGQHCLPTPSQFSASWDRRVRVCRAQNSEGVPASRPSGLRTRFSCLPAWTAAETGRRPASKDADIRAATPPDESGVTGCRPRPPILQFVKRFRPPLGHARVPAMRQRDGRGWSSPCWQDDVTRRLADRAKR